MKHINSIIKNLPGYAFAEVDKLVDQLKEKNIKPIDFGVGDPIEPTPVFIRESAKTAIDTRATSGYPSYVGSLEFRKKVSEWLNNRFNVSMDYQTEICSSIGSKEIIFNLPNAFIERGDYVLIPNPGYPPYSKGTMFAGGIPYFYNLKKENNFLPDLESIPNDIIKKAKILWINYPSNPTGSTAPKSFYEYAVKFAQKHNLILCSDECYSEIYYNEETKPCSVLEVTKENVLAFNSLSKRSCMTGWRVAWVAGDKELISIVKKLKTNIDSGIATFIQDAAITALSDEEHVLSLRSLYKRKRDIIIDAFKTVSLPDSTPDGTFYIWQELPKGMPEIELCKRLLDPEIAVVVTPGSWISEQTQMGNPGAGFIRIALVPTIEECIEASKRIIETIKSM